DNGLLTLQGTLTVAATTVQPVLNILDADGDTVFQIIVSDNSQRNLFIGRNIALASTSTVDNVAVGDNALRDLIEGDSNVCIGTDAGREIEDGSGNFCLGVRAGRDIVDNNNNTCIGIDSGRGIAGTSNFAIGSFALSTATGNFNIGLGRQAGFGLTGGASNIFLGDMSGRTADGQ